MVIWIGSLDAGWVRGWVGDRRCTPRMSGRACTITHRTEVVVKAEYVPLPWVFSSSVGIWIWVDGTYDGEP